MRRRFARLIVAAALGTVLNAGCASQFHPKRADYYFTTPEVVAAAKAIRQGNARGLERRIARGLDVNARGRDGMDLLKWSMARFCLKCFETLLEHGADIERPPAGEYTGKIEQLFLKPVMHLAAQFNDPAYLASLLRHGGDPNALDVYGSEQIINEAILRDRMANVRLLVDAGADINARAPGSMTTPLHTAVTIGKYEIAHYLLEHGADPMLRDKMGYSVIDDFKKFNIGYSNMDDFKAGKLGGPIDPELRKWFLKVADRLGVERDK